MDNKTKMTAHNNPAGTGVEQSPKTCINSISNTVNSVKVNSLETKTMRELNDTAFIPHKLAEVFNGVA